jgi:hypothetical protein
VLFEKQDAVWASMNTDGAYGNYDDDNVLRAAPQDPGGLAALAAARVRALLPAGAGAGRPTSTASSFLNEGEPYNGNHAAGANHFANYVHATGVRPILAAARAGIAFPDDLGEHGMRLPGSSTPRSRTTTPAARSRTA